MQGMRKGWQEALYTASNFPHCARWLKSIQPSSGRSFSPPSHSCERCPTVCISGFLLRFSFQLAMGKVPTSPRKPETVDCKT